MSVITRLLSSQVIGERNPLDDRWYGAGTQLSLTGIKVDQANALKLSAVWACTRLLTACVSSLPVRVMQRRKGSPVIIDDHPASNCLSVWPSADMGPNTFRQASCPQQINAGNCFSEIVQTPDGPELYPIHYSRVTPARRKEDNALGWLVKNDNADPTPLMDDEVLHVRSQMTNDGIMGQGVIEHARETIGFGLALEREGAARFANAGRPDVVMIGGKFKNDEARTAYRNAWGERHQGYQNRGKLFMAPDEAKLEKLEYSAVDQQYIESCDLKTIDVCRWYGCPPHLIQHVLAGDVAKVETMGQAFVTYNLLPCWIVPWEEEAGRKLLGKKLLLQGYYISFDVDALMRGDSAARAAWYNVMVNQTSTMNPNEVRAREGMSNIGPDGDKYRAPLNMTTLDKLGQSLPKPPDGRLIKRPAPGGMEPEEGGDGETEALPAVPDAGLSALVGATLGALQGLQREVWGLRDIFGRRKRHKRPEQQMVPVLPPPVVPDGRLEAAKSAALDNLLDVARVMVRQELQAVASAAKHPDKFLGRVEEFYGKHRERMAASLRGPAAVLVSLGTAAQDLAGSVAGHCETAQDELLALTDCQPDQLESKVDSCLRKWDTRAQALVDNLTKG